MWLPLRYSINNRNIQYQGLYSLSGKTSYHKISWSLEAARFGSKLFQSLWNLAGTSAAALPRRLSNFRVIRPLQHPISRLRDFTRFGGKTSYRLVNRGPASRSQYWSWHKRVSTDYKYFVNIANAWYLIWNMLPVIAKSVNVTIANETCWWYLS